jgi:hypothetical protein
MPPCSRIKIKPNKIKRDAIHFFVSIFDATYKHVVVLLLVSLLVLSHVSSPAHHPPLTSAETPCKAALATNRAKLAKSSTMLHNAPCVRKKKEEEWNRNANWYVCGVCANVFIIIRLSSRITYFQCVRYHLWPFLLSIL